MVGDELGLPRGLAQVGRQPLGRDRPGADQVLPRQEVQRAVRQRVGGRPAPEPGRPLVGDLGEHREPGAHVLGALGVVRGQRGHGARPRGHPPGVAVVELGGGDPEPVRVAAHLVQRDEPVVAVERGVLDALGHHHARRLLHPRGQLAVGVGEHRVADRRQHVRQVRPVHARHGHRGLQRRAPLGQVAAVDREAAQQLGDGLPNAAAARASSVRAAGRAPGPRSGAPPPPGSCRPPPGGPRARPRARSPCARCVRR